MDYEEHRGEVDVPSETGIAGFLHTIESILKLPRVQDIHVDSRGKVRYRFFCRPDEPVRSPGISFDALLPYGVMRNGKIVELALPDPVAAVAVGQLFNAVTADHLFPTVFVVGPETCLWQWYETTSCITPASREELCGVPVLTDRMLEEHVLVLCAAYARAGALVDTRKSYKIAMPRVKP